MVKNIKLIKAKKELTILFEKVNKDMKQHPIKTWFGRKLFQLQQLPSDIRLGVVGFFQRGKRGWADSDTWDFNDYLTEVIIAGMSHLKKHVHGYPAIKGMNSNRQWKNTLQKIINGFKAYKKTCDYRIMKNKKRYNKEIKQFESGMKLFTKYFGALWD